MKKNIIYGLMLLFSFLLCSSSLYAACTESTSSDDVINEWRYDAWITVATAKEFLIVACGYESDGVEIMAVPEAV